VDSDSCGCLDEGQHEPHSHSLEIQHRRQYHANTSVSNRKRPTSTTPLRPQSLPPTKARCTTRPPQTPGASPKPWLAQPQPTTGPSAASRSHSGREDPGTRAEPCRVEWAAAEELQANQPVGQSTQAEDHCSNTTACPKTAWLHHAAKDSRACTLSPNCSGALTQAPGRELKPKWQRAVPTLALALALALVLVLIIRPLSGA
jgi:hypothetical protein